MPSRKRARLTPSQRFVRKSLHWLLGCSRLDCPECAISLRHMGKQIETAYRILYLANYWLKRSPIVKEECPDTYINSFGYLTDVEEAATLLERVLKRVLSSTHTHKV
jgi:hypothetical protein